MTSGSSHTNGLAHLMVILILETSIRTLERHSRNNEMDTPGIKASKLQLFVPCLKNVINLLFLPLVKGKLQEDFCKHT